MIRKAIPDDIPKIMEIINDAKRSLKERGIDQWQSGYPNEEIILQDIKGGNSYVYYQDDELWATFGVFYGEDPTYVAIYDGAWLTENPYSVIHRVATNGHVRGKGIVGKIIAFVGEESLKNGFTSMRIDTHPDNRSMQRALEKAGYIYCGNIFLANGDLRLAYEKVLATKE